MSWSPPPGYRIGYLSLLLPGDTAEEAVPTLIRPLVVKVLAATAEWPAQITVITNTRMHNIGMRRWFVEYETGPWETTCDLVERPLMCRVEVGPSYRRTSR